MLYEGNRAVKLELCQLLINLFWVGGKSHNLPWNPPPPPSSEAGLFANSSFGSTSSSSSKEDSSGGCVFRLPSNRLVACCLVNVCFRLSFEAPASDSVELVCLSLVSGGGGGGVVVMLDNLLILSTVPRVGGGELC